MIEPAQEYVHSRNPEATVVGFLLEDGDRTQGGDLYEHMESGEWRLVPFPGSTFNAGPSRFVRPE